MTSAVQSEIPPIPEFMQDVLRVAEKATWKKEDLGGKLAIFTGAAEHNGKAWQVVLCTYDIEGDGRLDGAASRGGLLIRLLPEVAKQALTFARKGAVK